MVRGIVVNVNKYGIIYGEDSLMDIARLIDLYAVVDDLQVIRKDPSLLADAQVIMTGWGGICFDKTNLKVAQNLKLVLYGGGSVRGFVSNAFWERGIIVSSACVANAIPVAQYTLSQILACLKGFWRCAREVKLRKSFPPRDFVVVPGGYNSTVGVVSLGIIGRQVCTYLKNMGDLRVIAYDPYVNENQAIALGVEMCSLDEVFSRSDVVSIHTPLLEETRGMIGKELFASMKSNSSFINTARGKIVCEKEMVEVLKVRHDITAILDVTDTEPPLPSSPLYDMDNILLTPHISGSMQKECNRHGRYMVEELRRYVSGRPLRWAINEDELTLMA